LRFHDVDADVYLDFPARDAGLLQARFDFFLKEAEIAGDFDRAVEVPAVDAFQLHLKVHTAARTGCPAVCGHAFCHNFAQKTPHL